MTQEESARYLLNYDPRVSKRVITPEPRTPAVNMVDADALAADEELRIDKAYRNVVKAYLESNHRKKIEIIERAYRFAKHAHAGVRRRSGEPYILHPIAVAQIVISELGLGSTSICAAMLHDVVEDTEYTREDIEANFGPKVASIVEELTKISGGIFGNKASLQAENFRKLLLSMSTDVRVVLIKMADRLHNMRTLGSLRPEKQYKIAGETLYVYAPLAHRLGLFKIKQELEDLAFRYEHPAKYTEIMGLIEQSSETRQRIVDEFVAPVRQKLDAAGFKYEIKARVKSAYSIYKKMERKKLAFHDIYDVYAVRVVFDNDDDDAETLRCWQIYTFFAEGHRLHPDRLRDWTVTPKPNGYRALHLTVMGPEGRWIEVQIRSRRMDEIAELGYAAHWKYKTGEYDEEPRLEALMKKVKDILANPTPNALDFLDTVQLNLFSADIYVFTPKGDLITLPQGATVLDMAFAVHTQVGMHCVAGKIQHRLVPMEHRLSSGDQVEIITADAQKPERDWLDRCQTAKARNFLRSVLRKDKKALTEHGRRLFDEFLEKEGVVADSETMSRILAYYHLHDPEELFLMMAADEINLADTSALRNKTAKTSPSVLSRLLRNPFTLRRKQNHDKKPTPVNRREVYVLLPNASPPNYRIEACCSPLPGDDVLGFVTADEQVVVHKADCPVARKLKSTYGPRLVTTRWEGKADRFAVSVSVDGIDRHGMLSDIVQVVTLNMELNVRAMNIRAKNEVFHCEMQLMVDSAETVENLCRALKKVKDVKFANRTS